jgi:hypothetical protein
MSSSAHADLKSAQYGIGLDYNGGDRWQFVLLAGFV